MKPWIKALSPDDDLMRPIMSEFSYDGYGRFISVLEYCLEFDVVDLDEEIIRKRTRCNRKGAVKFLPLFQETLLKVWTRFRKTLPKVSPNFDQTLPKVEAQNTHGSTRDLEENRREEKRASSARELFSEDSKKVGREGLNYAAASGNPNMLNFSWVDGYLAKQHGAKPDIPTEILLQIWRECCDDASAKAVSSPKWYRTAFEDRVNRWNPSMATASPVKVGFGASTNVPSRADKLMSVERIRNIWEPEQVITTCNIHRDRFDQLWLNDEQLILSDYEPVEEAS